MAYKPQSGGCWLHVGSSEKLCCWFDEPMKLPFQEGRSGLTCDLVMLQRTQVKGTALFERVRI
jgi:hypothetical protein